MATKKDDFSLLIHGHIVTPYAQLEVPATGARIHQLLEYQDGAVAFNETILDIGPTEKLLQKFHLSAAQAVYDVGGRLVLPGFVDSHTHLPFAGTREKEIEWRLEGLSYQEIAKKGGGIIYTTELTRAASPESLKMQGEEYLNRMLVGGTTTIEAKSGYGLDINTELKQLQVIKELSESHPIDIIPTFLGAHAIPPGETAEIFTEKVISAMIPKVKDQGIAEFIDVFCEENYFTPEQTRRIVKAGAEAGLKPKLHVDEFASGFGGAELAGELGAISADHLLKISRSGIKALADNMVIGTLLPGTPFVLGSQAYAPARSMIDAGVPIALATDFNPNCMLLSMPMVMTLATYNMGLKSAETVVASTINAAWAINRHKSVGSLTPGKLADMVVLPIKSIHFISYLLGQGPIDFVFKRGDLVVDRGQIILHRP